MFGSVREGDEKEMSAEPALEMFRTVVEYGRDALKAAMLINGGAAVAVLAFIGNIWTIEGSDDAVRSLACAVAMFGFGVLFAAVSSAFTYITQYFYNMDTVFGPENPTLGLKYRKIAISFHCIVLFLVFSSFGLFCAGVVLSFQSITKHLS